MDKECTHQPLLLEKASGWLSKKCREFSIPILATFVWGLLAYMFAFTNKLINHDDVSALFHKGASTAIGRWGLKLAEKILPNYSMPWIYGILSLALMAIAICLIIHIFQIRNKLLQILLAGSIMVFPSMIGTFSYMFMSSTYSACYLFSVMAVWLVNVYPKRGFLPAVGFLVLSLSLYQAHVSVAAGLLVLILIQRLLQEDQAWPIIKKGLFFVLFLIISLGLYYLITQLLLLRRGTGFDGYASGSMSFSITSLPADIAEAYKSFFQYIFEGELGLIPTVTSRKIHYCFFLAIGVLFTIWFVSQRKSNPLHLLLMAALLLILPLAMNCIHLFATKDSIHTMVVFGFSTIYVLAVVIADACIPLLSHNSLRRGALNVLTLAMTLIILVNTFVANQSYLNLHLRYENAYAFYTSLIADIKMMPEFEEDTRLAVIGVYDQPSYYEEKFEVTRRISGVYGFLPDSYSNNLFMEYYIGFPIEFATMAEVAEIQNSPEYQQMNRYPYYGSMQMFGDILVVKLS